ncbi:DnaJ-domain-containing protein, partial [Ramicandelaber brevisporus]
MKAVSLARSLLFVSTIIALITLFSSAVRAWDDLDYEIFDLVDGIKKTSFPASIIPEAKASTTFYDILGVSASADDRELARAFKKLARTHHPDKNPSEETRVLYNTLDAIHKILRDPTKRERYNFFMRNGVPVWRDGRYYYSRWRPGFGTAATGLLVFVSGVQYLLAWVGYWRAQQSI